MLLFWGPRPAQGGCIKRTCFSQWFEAQFELDGVAASPVDFVWGTGFAADSPLRARGGVR
jgi:hypothetical protein